MELHELERVVSVREADHHGLHLRVGQVDDALDPLAADGHRLAAVQPKRREEVRDGGEVMSMPTAALPSRTGYSARADSQHADRLGVKPERRRVSGGGSRPASKPRGITNEQAAELGRLARALGEPYGGRGLTESQAARAIADARRGLR
jgi:hypothetical protein